MNEITAIKYLANIKWSAEACLMQAPESESSFEVFCIENPFLYGKDSFLPKCVKALNSFMDDSGTLSPRDFYEIIWKAFHCEDIGRWLAIAPMEDMQFIMYPDITWIINGWVDVDENGQPIDKIPNVWYNDNGVILQEDNEYGDIIPS